MFSNPLLLGLAAALVAGLVTSFLVGVWRGGRNEVSAGLHALCGLKWRVPMLVVQGELDFRIPTTQGLATFTALQRRGIESQLLVFPNENHWVLKPQNSVQWHDTVNAWLAKHLKD